MGFRSFRDACGGGASDARALRPAEPGFGFVLRRALRHDAVGLDLEALRRQRALQHHFRIVLERVRDDAAVAGR